MGRPVALLYDLGGHIAIAALVISSAGKKHSMRSSCIVMCCGVPNVVIVVKKRSVLPSCR
jgi:hypothetical protein